MKSTQPGLPAHLLCVFRPLIGCVESQQEFWMFQPLGPRDFEIPFKDLPRGAAQTQIDTLDKSTSLRSPLIAGPLLDELFGHPIAIGGFG